MVEGQGFRDELKNFEKKNAIIIGMSADSVQRQKNFSEKQGFQFQLLSDESKDVLKAYEAWGKKKLYGREYEGIFRFTYVIDESGKISYAYPKVKVKTHVLEKFHFMYTTSCQNFTILFYFTTGTHTHIGFSVCQFS